MPTLHVFHVLSIKIHARHRNAQLELGFLRGIPMFNFPHQRVISSGQGVLRPLKKIMNQKTPKLCACHVLKQNGDFHGYAHSGRGSKLGVSSRSRMLAPFDVSVHRAFDFVGLCRLFDVVFPFGFSLLI